MTQGQFQIRLTRMIDRLLDICEKYQQYRFYFDGQTIALKDYVEVRPENRDRLSGLMRSGRIAAGPWYGLADQFIPGGETVLRNLLEGRRSCRELGGEPVRLGYVPDSFGSNSALPMLLNEFGIRYAVFGRGRPRDKFHPLQNEFRWESSSGASVLAANFGYACGIFLSYPDLWTDIRRFKIDPRSVLLRFMDEAAKQRKQASSRHLYFSVSIDHMEARESLPEIVDYINSHQNEYVLRFGLPTDYLDGVEKKAKKMVVYRGEQCGSKKFPMDLIGTLSSHVELKQANFHCENLLAGAVEPMAVMAEHFAGEKYPAGILRKMWQLLLANQTHDSICGCSIDQVHRDMMSRYEFIEKTAVYCLKDAMSVVAEKIDVLSEFGDAPVVTVFNPLCGRRRVPVRAMVAVPRRFIYKHYRLVDAAGVTISARIRRIAVKQMDLESVYMMPEQLAALLSKDVDTERSNDQVFTILDLDFIAEDLPMCGWKTWYLQPGKPQAGEKITITDNGMKNEFLQLDFLPNGSFDLIDLRNGRKIHEALYFEDREDVGNLYDHASLPKIEQYDTLKAKAKITVEERLPHRATFKITIPQAIPAGIENDARSSRKVNMPLTVRITLYDGIPRVDITVDCTNKARNHCLQAVFNSGVKTSTCASDTAFEVVTRPVDAPGPTWKHRPMQNFVDASDGRHGLCIMSKGLYSQLATKDKDGATAVHVTLLRCTGRLGPAAGADYYTPAGQCVGRHHFELALMPHEGDWLEGGCPEAAAAFSRPVCAIASLPHPGTLPVSGSAITVDAIPIVSCLKRAEQGDGVIFRGWNLTLSAVEATPWGVLTAGQKIVVLRADETLHTKTGEKIVAAPSALLTLGIGIN